MKIWPGWRLTVKLERSTPYRCRRTLNTADGPVRCIFEAGHPDHGHNMTEDITAPPAPSPGLLKDRRACGT